MSSYGYPDTSKPLPSIHQRPYSPSPAPSDRHYEAGNTAGYSSATAPPSAYDHDIFAPLNHTNASQQTNTPFNHTDSSYQTRPPFSHTDSSYQTYNRYTHDEPFEANDDIPLQNHHSKADPTSYNSSFDPNLERQPSDTVLLNPQSDQTNLKKKPSIWSNIPWVVYILSLVQICVFIAELVKMSNLTGSPIETKPSFNPMIGPSPYLLINMGARYVPCMRLQDQVQNNKVTNWPCPNATKVLDGCSLSDLCGFQGSARVPNPSTTVSMDNPWDQPAPNQWFRFITPIFLHGGFIHISGNILLQLLLGRDMEKAIGSVRFFIVYFSAGIFGFVLGGNFAQSGIAST